MRTFWALLVAFFLAIIYGIAAAFDLDVLALFPVLFGGMWVIWQLNPN